MPRPLLLRGAGAADGRKFDLRLYVILICALPPLGYLSERGVARFASHAWAPLAGVLGAMRARGVLRGVGVAEITGCFETTLKSSKILR